VSRRPAASRWAAVRRRRALSRIRAAGRTVTRAWSRFLRWTGGPWVATQLIIVVAGAFLTGAAAWAYSAASGSWQEAVRLEVSRSNGIQEDVRAVYDDEAPIAFRLALDRCVARALRPLGEASRLAVSQRTTAEQSAYALQQAAKKLDPESLASYGDIEVRCAGPDVVRRLADMRTAGESPADPEASRAQGDRAAQRAGLLALLTAGITGAAMAAAMIPPRRRGRRVTAAGDEAEVEILPQPRLAEPARRRLATSLLVLWGAGVVLPLVQLALSAEEQRSQATSARYAVLLTSDLAVGMTRSAFGLQVHRLPLELQAKSLARQYGAVDADPASAADEEAVAGAEDRAALDAAAVGRQMARDPLPSDGLEPRVVQALMTDPLEGHPLADPQRAETRRADRFGGWSNAVVALIAAILAVAAGLQIQARHR
jgi:hypothetical protein